MVILAPQHLVTAPQHLVTASADLHRLAKLLEVNEKGNSTETLKKKATMAHGHLKAEERTIWGKGGRGDMRQDI